MRINDISLQPLQSAHFDQLSSAAADPCIWQNHSLDLSNPDIFKEQWFDKALRQVEQGKRHCFVVQQGEKLLGSTSYYNLDQQPEQLSIGYSWLHPDCWGAGVNAAAKFLMLQNALENSAVQQVTFNVDQQNTQSQKALTKLAIKQLALKGDKVVFAVTQQDWPELKKSLLEKINVGS